MLSKRERDELRRLIVDGEGEISDNRMYALLLREVPALLDAADEAWALRHNYDYQRERADALADERDRLRSENERLCNALEFYSDPEDWEQFEATSGVGPIQDGDIVMAFTRGEDAPWRIAEDALNDTADQTAGVSDG